MIYYFTNLLIFLFIEFFIRNTGAQTDNNLKLVQILYRHGERNPIDIYKNSPYQESSWPQGLGQLSEKGILEHYNLGQFFRRRYIEGSPYKLLNSSYNQFEVSVRSTDVDRTIMSAESNLAGLYPPEGKQIWKSDIKWQPIPVHTILKASDYLLSMDFVCPTFNNLYNDILNSPEIRKCEADNKEFYAFLEEKTGNKGWNIDNSWKIIDDFYGMQSYNYSLPDWAFVKFDGKTVFDKLEILNNMQYILRYTKPDEPRLRGGPLLGQMIKNINTKLQDSSCKKKAYFYSAHDSTVAALMGALNIFNDIAPPYSSTLFVEFHTSNDNSKKFVRLLFLNDTNTYNLYPLQIPGCELDCELSQFLMITKQNIPDDILLECDLIIEDPYDSIALFIFIGIFVGIGIIGLIIILIKIICFKRIHGKPKYNLIA